MEELLIYSTLFKYLHVVLLFVSVVFGSWNDHVKNWWKKTQSYSKLHFMFYEDMVEIIYLFWSIVIAPKFIALLPTPLVFVVILSY